MPMMGIAKLSLRTMACRAGKIFLLARSPVAPKKTNESDSVVFMSVSPEVRDGVVAVLPSDRGPARRRQDSVPDRVPALRRVAPGAANPRESATRYGTRRH